MLCVWWDQKDVVYYELLKPGETVNTKRYQQQLIDLNRSLLKKTTRKRQHKIIFLHDNAPSHTAKPIRGTLEALSWEVLLHAAYSRDLAPSDYHLHRWITHLLSNALVRTIRRCEKNDSMNGSRQKRKIFTGVESTNCPKDGKNV